MKKFIYACSLGFIFTICIFTLSCESNSKDECKTCSSDNYSLINVDFFNSDYDFKKYDDLPNSFHLGLAALDTNKFELITNNLLSNTKITFNKKELIGFCAITNDSAKDNEKKSVNANKIDGLLLYSMNANNNIEVRFLKKESNQFVENKLSKIKIGYITTNNIFDFTKIFFDDNEKMVYLVVSPRYRMNESIDNVEVDTKLNILKSNFYRVPKTCGVGCTSNDGKRCALGNSGKFFCKEDENCPKEDAERKLVESNITKYNYIKITEDLHFFRGNYLKSYDGGQKIIDDYYELGRNLPISFYTIENCTTLFDLLEGTVLPITNNLVDNPNDKNILIDSLHKEKLKNYLIDIKRHYNDQNSKDKIDYLIQKLEFFSNKSNEYITNNLNLY